MHDPRSSARLVAWGNAWLTGHVGLDDVLDAMAADTTPSDVMLPGRADRLPLPLALGELRRRGTRALHLALPVPGDASGLPGPPAFNAAAVAAGEAVLTLGAGAALGLVPAASVDRAAGSGWRWRWTAYDVDPPRPGVLPSLPDAERYLRETLLEVTQSLLRLDVARWRPEVADALRDIRDGAGADDVLPPGYPPRARSVLALARRLSAITDLAGDDPGAAVSAREMAARLEALRPLARASRLAQVAAYNAVAGSAGFA